MKRKVKFLVIAIAALVVLGGVLSIVLSVTMRYSSSQNDTVSGPSPQYAAPGTLVSGFPGDLILDPQARIDNSYTIDYASGTTQYTATFDSEQSIDWFLQEYEDYFAKNGWAITNHISYPDSEGLYAVNANQDQASVSIINQTGQTQVIVAYVVGQ